MLDAVPFAAAGTGKSSLVCALCVGLGGSTKVCVAQQSQQQHNGLPVVAQQQQQQ
jgi:predicted AAA+ superfamily ATPase